MRYRPLGRTGLEVSPLGFGAAPLGAVYGTFAEQDGIDIALQYSVTTGMSATTVVGSAVPVEVPRIVRWIEESIDEVLLTEVERWLAPVPDQGWVDGRPENEKPGGQP